MQYLVLYRLSTGQAFYSTQCEDLLACAKEIERTKDVLSPRTIVETYKLVDRETLE